ncbi:hypothetical protein ACKWTF_015369 [Chironomus riparius]
MKTIIHKIDITKDQEAEYHQKIRNWLKDISKVKYCKELLDVVNQCENLKIIFDFESELVDDAALYDSTASKFPFTDETISINAKLSATRIEQEIKGVLARELCRYALCLTYDNTSHPYYKHDSQAAQNFDEIIKTIINWTSEDSSMSNKIIKSVISTSTSDTIQMDLISSMIQTFVQFDNDKEELTRFEVKFKILFDYFENFVLPEMKKLNLKFRKNVRKFNKMADILPSILSLELELSELKDVKSLTELNFSIIQTNLPKLFLINIQKCLGTLFDVQNIFISADKLHSQELHDLLAQDPNLNVFVICSRKIDKNLKNIFTSKLTFIVSDDNQCQELTQQLTESGLSPTKVEVNFGWNDLTVDSQRLLLEMKINFQNNSEFSFLDILKDEFHPEDEEVVRNFNDIVDDQLLGLMIEGSVFEVNVDQDHEKEVENWFQERKFIKQKLDTYNNWQTLDGRPLKCSVESLSQEELLQDCLEDKFVIISDKPGSGKSWTIKKFSKILKTTNPTIWVTYVDLKQFTEQFKDQMALRREVEFPDFFAETILKEKSQFQIKIFKKLYDLGKVSIFLDGLDELTPSCTDFILKQVKTFESNEGSQLWIAACETLDVDIEKILLIDTKYKFEELTNNKLNLNSALKFGPTGMPQLCKIISEITKDDKSASTELTELKIYKEFTQNLQKKWQNQQDSGTETQNLNFWMFHELMAMKSLFPSYSDFIDQNLADVKTLKDKSILAKSLLTKTGQNFDFLHSTFRDFFVAEFILRILRQEEVPNWFLQFLLKVLTTRRYQCIRMFLNQGFGDLSELKLSDKTVKGITANIDEFTNISFVFGENLENLQKFFVMCLNKRRYKVVKSILVSNLDASFGSIKRSEIPINPQILLDFLVKFLNSKCLENLIKEKKLFFTIIESCEDVEHFERFANAVKAKLGALFVVQSFKGSRHSRHSNIFFAFCWSKNVDRLKAQNFIKILRRFLNIRKFMELLKTKSRWNSRSVFIDIIEQGEPEVLKALWTEIENFYKSNESHQKFKELVMLGESHQNILSTVARSNHIKLHEVLWDLLKGTLKLDELKSFINNKNASFTDYFLYIQMTYSDSPQIIEFTFEKLQAMFSYEDFTEILEQKPYSKCNLLYRAAEVAKNTEIFTSVWNLMRNYCKSDKKFVELIKKLDNHGTSILTASMRSSETENIEFIINELKAIAARDEIKSLLTAINNSNQNIFFKVNDSKLFSTVWNVICDFLEPSEMLEILQSCDFSGNNFISNINHDSHLIRDVWGTVRGFINQHADIFTIKAENIEECDKVVEKWTKVKDQDTAQVEIIKLRWLMPRIYSILDSPETRRLEITKSNLFSCAYDFYILANCENLEIHEVSWEFILKKYENRQDLVKLMTKRSVHGSIFIHSIMSNKSIKVIEFVIKIIADNFSEAEIRELLTVKCSKGVTAMSHTVTDFKNPQIAKMLWTLHQKCFNSAENADLIAQTNVINSNIILDATASSADIFKFIWSEANKLYDSERFIELVSHRMNYQKSILQVCVEQHDIKLLKVVWNEVKKLLDGSLRTIVKLFTVNEHDSYDWYNDIMKIIEVAAKCDKIEFHEALWELLWETFKEQDELKSLILWKNYGTAGKAADDTKNEDQMSRSVSNSEDDNYSDCQDYDKNIQEDDEHNDFNEHCNYRNILCCVLNIFQCPSIDVIKFTMKNFDKILTKNEIAKILKLNDYYCFLQNQSDSIEKHQLLWDIYRQYLTVADLKKFANQFFSMALCNAATISVEIFEFTWNQAIKEAEDVVIPALESDVHILCSCIQHKDTALLKIVWTKVEEFYKVQNLPESFKAFVIKQNYSENIFQVLSEINDLEVHKTLWELLFSTFEDREELKRILIRKYDYYGCLIAEIFENNDLNVVKFLVKILQESFTDSQLQEMMISDSRILQNCLENEENNFEIFKIWWEFFKNIFQTSQKFIEFIKANNNFNVIFGHANEQILELAFNDLKSFMTRDEIRKKMLKMNKNCENILHVALYRDKASVAAYKLTWKYIQEYLDTQEIINLLSQKDSCERTFLLYLVSRASKDIFDIAWTVMKTVLSYDDQVKALKVKHPAYGNLYNSTLTYLVNSDECSSWMESTFREYRIRINQ